MSEQAQERAAALAALTAGAEETPAPAPGVQLTGREVEVGGDVERVLVKRASTLGHVNAAGVYVRAEAAVGDVVRLTQAQADRLDGLGVTATRDMFDAPAPADAPEEGSDAHLEGLTAADLIAYVGQNPDAAPRVRELELGRPEKAQRATVLAATDPEKLAGE